MSGRSTDKAGIRSAGDSLRNRQFHADGQTIFLADSSAALPLDQVGFRLKLPDEYIHTRLSFTWSEQRGRCDLHVDVGPVWVSSRKEPGRKKKLKAGDSHDLVMGDLVHLTDRRDDDLTIELYRESTRPVWTMDAAPKRKRKEPTPGELLPDEPVHKAAPRIVEDEEDVNPKGLKRKLDKRVRTFRKTYIVPWRKRWGEVKYWQTTAKSAWRGAMAIVSMAAGVLGLVALWNYIDSKRPTLGSIDESVEMVESGYFAPAEETALLKTGLLRLASGDFDGFTDDPGKGFVPWSRWPEGVAAAQLPSTAWTSFAAEAAPALTRVESRLEREFGTLHSAWCLAGTAWAPLRYARQQAVKAGQPAQWLLAYGPAVRTQFCPMFNDRAGRTGWTGTLLPLPDGDTRRRHAQTLLGAPDLPVSAWLDCVGGGRLIQWAALLQGRPVGPEHPAPALPDVKPKLIEVRSVEYDTVVADLTSKVAAHRGLKTLDAYLFALWRHDVGDAAIDGLVQHMLASPAVTRTCGKARCVGFLQARRWAQDQAEWTPEQTDFPLEVLSWYLLFEQTLQEQNMSCGPPVAP